MYRKNVAGQHVPFALVNASTGAALTGATVTVYKTVDGAAQAAAGGSVSELGNGQYDFAPSQADTNGNVIGFLMTATSAIPVHFTIVTTAADPTNATTFGLGNLDAAVSSRSTYAGADTSGTTTLLSRISAAITITSGKVDVNDKSGFSLSSAGIQAIWDAATTALTTAGSIGKRIVDCLTGDVYGRLGAPAGASIAADIAAVKTDTANVDVAVSTRLADSSYTAPDNASIAAILDDTGTSGVIVDTNNDKSDYALSAAGVQAIWDALSAALTTVGSIGKRLVDYLTGDSYARLGAPAGADIAADIAAIKTDTGALDTSNLDVAVSTRLATSGYTAPPSAVAVRSEIDSNSTQLAAIVADTNELQGDWTDGGRLDLLIDAVKAKTDNLPASPAATSDIPDTAAVADKLLGRNLAGGSDGGRTVNEALRALRNKVDISGTTLTVMEEDDTTPSWTANLTTNASAEPITSIDPA